MPHFPYPWNGAEWKTYRDPIGPLEIPYLTINPERADRLDVTTAKKGLTLAWKSQTLFVRA